MSYKCWRYNRIYSKTDRYRDHLRGWNEILDNFPEAFEIR
eukprot:UN07959